MRKKILLGLAAAGALLVYPALHSMRGASPDQVGVCHIPPGQYPVGHVIYISPNAVPAHFAHGDHYDSAPEGTTCYVGSSSAASLP